MKTKTIPTTVEAEVMEAYCDAHGNTPFEQTLSRGNLNFKASAPVTRDEAVRIMGKAIDDSYNEFTADLLKLLPENCSVVIAREGSPCIYVTPPILTPVKEMLADEWTQQPDGSTRIWFD